MFSTGFLTLRSGGVRFIMARAEASVPSAIFARLTSISPTTVAKVCRRRDPSAHWCDGPQGTTPPFFDRRNSSSTFHCPHGHFFLNIDYDLGLAQPIGKPLVVAAQFLILRGQ